MLFIYPRRPKETPCVRARDGDGWGEYHGCHGGGPIAKPLFMSSVQASTSQEQERERESQRRVRFGVVSCHTSCREQQKGKHHAVSRQPRKRQNINLLLGSRTSNQKKTEKHIGLVLVANTRARATSCFFVFDLVYQISLFSWGVLVFGFFLFSGVSYQIPTCPFSLFSQPTRIEKKQDRTPHVVYVK